MRVEVAVAGRGPSRRAERGTERGMGMVVANETVVVTYRTGDTELLKAGVTRLAPDHPLVKQRPGLFLPCDREDKATATRMRELTGSSGRVLEQRTQREPGTPVHGRHQLRPRRQPHAQLR